MARGSVAKEQITNQILAAFPGSFKYDKEIRIPVAENGETIQIKVTLTAAKTNVEAGGDTALPGSVPVASSTSAAPAPKLVEPERTIMEPTEEEKQTVSELLKILNLQ